MKSAAVETKEKRVPVPWPVTVEWTASDAGGDDDDMPAATRPRLPAEEHHDDDDSDNAEPVPVLAFGSSSFPVDHLKPSIEAIPSTKEYDAEQTSPPPLTESTTNSPSGCVIRPNLLRLPTWRVVCGSVVVVATVALLVAVVGALSYVATTTASSAASDSAPSRFGREPFRAEPRRKNVVTSYEALVWTTRYACDTSPPPAPALPCLIWDWDERRRQDGALVNYYCAGRNDDDDDGGRRRADAHIPYVIAMCSGLHGTWNVVTDHSDQCVC